MHFRENAYGVNIACSCWGVVPQSKIPSTCAPAEPIWEQHLHDAGLVIQIRAAIACAERVDASAF